jgi:hypothetical protein
MDSDCLLLDVTTIITLISDTSHRASELIPKFSTYVDKAEQKNRYYDKIKSITEEMRDELENPLYPKLLNIIHNKKLYMVEEARDRILSDMMMIMNVNERKRFDELMAKVTIIKSDISDRFKDLDATRWKKSNRAVFGTADKLKIKLLTGNRKAVVTVLDGYRFDMDITVHRSRDLVGNRILQHVNALTI